MDSRAWIIGAATVFSITLSWLNPASAQTAKAKADSTMPQAQLTSSISDTTVTEIDLGVIDIKGRVEKPGVIILPKRVAPKLEEVELERSFVREVKEGVGEIPKPEKELSKIERVKSIKKTVGRKRK